MKKRYDVWTSKEVNELFAKIWGNTYISNLSEKNTQTDLAFSLNKSGGTIGEQLAALSDAGLLTKAKAGQKVIYAPDMEGIIIALNDKLLPKKYRLSDKEIITLVDWFNKHKFKDAIISDYNEESNFAKIRSVSTPSILEIVSVFFASGACWTRVKRKMPKDIVKNLGTVPKEYEPFDDITPEIIAKLEHIKVPKTMMGLFAFITVLSRAMTMLPSEH